MSALTLSIAGRPVTVSCADGNEERMTRLAADLSKTIALLREQPLAARAAEGDILILAALSVLERLDRAEERIAALNMRNRELDTARAMVLADAREARDGVANRIDKLATEIEALAAELTKGLSRGTAEAQGDAEPPLEG